MALKKTGAIQTFKGTTLTRLDDYTKLVKGNLASNNKPIVPTDMASGSSADYGNFVILIDDSNQEYMYVPGIDVDWYNNLSDTDKEELCSGSTEVFVISRENKKGNTYYVTEVI